MKWSVDVVPLLVLQLSLAHAAGFTGYSGKQGMDCNQCHSGGTAPTVTLTGPASLMVGAAATYTVTITGGAAVRGGFNAATSAGGLIAGANAKLVSGELTHVAPQPFNAGSLAFSFTLEAPMQAGALTLYAAGNSVNFNTTNVGDRAATASLNVMVVDSMAPVDAGTAAPADGGSGSPGPIVGGGPSSSDGGVAPLGDGSNGGNGGNTLITGSGRRGGGYPGGVIDGGCSAVGGAPLAVLLAAVTCAARRTRRRAADR